MSTNLFHDGVFFPRVPQSRHPLGEDDKTPRVSVSTSVAGCFTAIPGGGDELDWLLKKQAGIFKLFQINTEKLGILNDQIIPPSTLFQNHSVIDATFSNEHWILTSFEVPTEDSHIIMIKELNNEKYTELDLPLPSTPSHYKRIVTDVTYQSADLKKGDSIVFYFEGNDQEVWFHKLKKYPGVAELSYDCNVRFTANEHCNVQELFFLYQQMSLSYTG